MKFLFLFLLIISSSIYAELTFSNDGTRGLLNIYSAKCIKEGRMSLTFSPMFSMDNIAIKKYSGSSVKWSDFPTNNERNTGTIGMFMPVSFGYGWNDYVTSSIGIDYYYDKIDLSGTGGNGISKKGFGGFNFIQKFSIPTADTVFNIGFLAKFSSRIYKDKDGLLLRTPNGHYKASTNSSFGAITSRDYNIWAIKGIIPLTIDISAKNPDIRLKFYVNVGFQANESNSPIDNFFLGNLGVSYDPHPSFGLFALLNSTMKYQNLMHNADPFKDNISTTFGFNTKSNHVSFTAGAEKALIENPSDQAYYEDLHTDTDTKALNSATNAALYTREYNNNTYLINQATPQNWKIYAQIGFYWYIIAKDVDGDGILDSFDKCPQQPEDFDGFDDEDGCPDPDNDMDGVPDLQDKCPAQPEDMDGFQDNDGCPDPDNDGDGIADVDDKCPGTDANNTTTKEDMDGFQDNDGCPDPDNDKDGILDTQDKCPNEPEDMDGDRDTDGCPDLTKDSDKDGIEDKLDKCPTQPEDMDGFQDKDGCPEQDNDGDGIPDKLDKCPGTDADNTTTKEDMDGFQDADGCPDPDNDGDGVPDISDKCPGTDITVKAGEDTKENMNGLDDTDGCPDKKVAPIIKKKAPKIKKISKKAMKLKVFFASGKARLTRDSYPALEELLEKMRSDKDAIIQIDGHTDSKGRYSYNKKLSRRRASAVKVYLIKHDIDPSRIKTKGWGPDKPIADNDTPEGRELNRRIEVKRIN